MSVEDFIRNVEKINGGENLPESYLRDSYQSIAKDEIKCCRDFALTDHLTSCILYILLYTLFSYLVYKSKV